MLFFIFACCKISDKLFCFVRFLAFFSDKMIKLRKSF